MRLIRKNRGPGGGKREDNTDKGVVGVPKSVTQVYRNVTLKPGLGTIHICG